MRRALVAVALLGLGGGLVGGARADEPPKGGPSNAPPTNVEAAADIDGEWRALAAPSAADFRRFLARYRAAPDGAERARSLAAKIVETYDPNDRAARETLGHAEFAYDIPEEISYRRYPFVRIVEEAREVRWFADLRPYATALEALVRCHEHARRLATDDAYAALDVARRGIDQDEHLRPYNYDAVFASPYLICYSTSERIDEAGMWRMPPAERAKAWAERDRRRAGDKRVLAEKARIYTQVYERFLATYGEACDLHPLMEPYGGRPDYPAGRRSYREGCALVVWVFSDEEAWTAHHETVLREPIARDVVGYFHAATGLVYVRDQGPKDRDEEIDVNARIAVRQLIHWFARQRNEWGRPWFPQQYFSSGFGDWFGTARLAKDRTLTFGGVSPRRLTRLRTLKESMAARSKKLPVFPLRLLTEFEGYDDVQQWGVQTWSLDPALVLRLFELQSWAFFHFLDEFDGGRRRAVIAKLLNAMLRHPRDNEGYLATQTRTLLGIEGEEGWKALDEEFAAFYAELVTREVAADAPPALDDWPGYVAPDLEAPTGPAK